MARGPLVWDLETAEAWDEIESFGEWRTHAGVSLACTYDVDTDQYEFFTPHNLAGLADRLESSSNVVSFNGVGFDHVVLDAALGRHVYIPKETDLWEIIRASLTQKWPKGSWKLDAIARRTLGQGKNDKGAMAPQLALDGKWGELITYNVRDVWLTKELWRFMTTYGYVIDPEGQKHEVGVWVG